MGARLRALGWLGAALGLLACGERTGGGGRAAPSSSAVASAHASARASGGAPSAGPSGRASAGPTASGAASGAAAPSAEAEAASSASPVASFEPVAANKACKPGAVDVAQYLKRGELAIAAKGDRVAVSWLTQVSGKKLDQVAFTTYDADARSPSRPRGIGLSEHVGPRAFAVGSEWTVTWFDENGLAFAQPKEDPLPAPEIQHLTAVGPGEEEKVVITHASGDALIAAAILASTKGQIALFQFAPVDGGPAVKALGVTHHAKNPEKPALAADPKGIILAWLEPGNRIAGSHFDAAGKERDSACTIAAPSATARDRLALAPVKGGAIAMWSEGESIVARPVDERGCPRGPRVEVGKGKWPRIVAAGDGALLAWVDAKGKLVAAQLDPKATPPEKGIEVADVVGGVTDPAAVAVAGSRAAFAWAESMSATVKTKRIMLRTIDLACLK